jgi:hypothetical protein
MTALATSGLLDGLDPSKLLGDKGYQGSGMITPVKKPRLSFVPALVPPRAARTATFQAVDSPANELTPSQEGIGQ